MDASQMKLMKGWTRPLSRWPGLRDASMALAKAECSDETCSRGVKEIK